LKRKVLQNKSKYYKRKNFASKIKKTWVNFLLKFFNQKRKKYRPAAAPHPPPACRNASPPHLPDAATPACRRSPSWRCWSSSPASRFLAALCHPAATALAPPLIQEEGEGAPRWILEGKEEGGKGEERKGKKNRRGSVDRP